MVDLTVTTRPFHTLLSHTVNFHLKKKRQRKKFFKRVISPVQQFQQRPITKCHGFLQLVYTHHNYLISTGSETALQYIEVIALPPQSQCSVPNKAAAEAEAVSLQRAEVRPEGSRVTGADPPPLPASKLGGQPRDGS